ncbi:spore germination protein [Halalkalibacter hemicellulosilyticus]|uniref:Stage V sporulation protein AF n=1 Tax=Halalkalibacter hemicellulosilyticusJCM 9152 TaxID=1236971 RepID=W4QHA8_9BACI|nr:spore germination protein [Halalkalibacter hemicellulosilyticus]GAE30734.1 stage V sporulation protein AF [Halalkalibacter hemicellulosilyticusJCM 9152]
MKEEQTYPTIADYHQTISYLKKELAIDDNFDLIHLELEYGGRQMSLFLVDGFGKDQALTEIQKQLIKLSDEDLQIDPLEKLMKHQIPYVEIEKSDDLDEVIDQVLSGPAALVVDGIDQVILIDTREYPVRGPEEPDTEKVIRGARDGFVETLVLNAALVRRRVRDRTMRVEYVQVGRRSKSDMAITYVADIADQRFVKKLKRELKKIDTDGFPMADKTVEEYIYGHSLNPYPLVRYTERPDVAATHLLEGHVLIMVDGSPSVMITPASFWHHLQHAEEYRQKPLVGAVHRFIRYIAVWASLFLLPIWYLLATHEQFVPAAFGFIGEQETGVISLFVQFLIAEIGIEMLRMAAIHTPNALATALGLVAAILIGEVAIEVGLFSPEVVLYLAAVAIGSYATPSYELSLANRLVRLSLLILTAAFGLTGFTVGTTLWFLLLVHYKGLGIPYLWPFLPFDAKAFSDVLVRKAMPYKHQRPSILHPGDPDR